MPAAATPPNDLVDLVLHIGSGKTGTSSIQSFLHQNRAPLADLGYLYPRSPGSTRHTRLSLFVQADEALDGIPTWRRERDRFASPERFRRAFRRRLFREIRESGLSHVLLSDEALYGSPDPALRRLSRFAHRISGSLRLVVYLRRQDDHLVSRYQQVVKVGETRRLAERTRQLDLSKNYDYHARLRTHQKVLAPTEFVVRRFERDRFADGSLYQDFLDAAGIDVRAGDLAAVEPVNESLDAEAVEFLRLLNLYRVENEGVTTGLTGNGRLVKQLAAAATGPTLTLPDAVLDEFMAQWEESNRRVARDLLGEEKGQLFDAPRKSHNTTTEQHLDPARLDHFLSVTALPEQTHAPLRALAEREAKGR